MDAEINETERRCFGTVAERETILEDRVKYLGMFLAPANNRYFVIETTQRRGKAC